MSNTKGPFWISLMFIGFNLVTIVLIIELFIYLNATVKCFVKQAKLSSHVCHLACFGLQTSRLLQFFVPWHWHALTWFKIRHLRLCPTCKFVAFLRKLLLFLQ